MINNRNASEMEQVLARNESIIKDLENVNFELEELNRKREKFLEKVIEAKVIYPEIAKNLEAVINDEVGFISTDSRQIKSNRKIIEYEIDNISKMRDVVAKS